jgi:hypothetical protein
VNYVDQLRADAYRWLLTIAETHHLPMPARIETYELTIGWSLVLHLDDDQGDDVRRWAAVVDLPMNDDLSVIGDKRRWTAVSAFGTAPDVIFAGWRTMRINSHCDFITMAAPNHETDVDVAATAAA